MKSEIITIDNIGNGRKEALKITEDMGNQAGLDYAQSLRLRLLCEELIGMLRGIAGEIKADYYIECEQKEFKLHLSGEVVLDKQIHDKLVNASSEGKNSAAKGFTGKLREMIGTLLLPGTITHTMISGFSMGLVTMGDPSSVTEGYQGMENYLWSMQKYVSEVKDSGDEVVWDELEKSIIVNAADEVQVAIKNPNVEMIVSKAF